MSEDVAFVMTLPLPGDAVPQHGLAVVAFFDAEGNTCYRFVLEGDAPLSSILGIIELVRAQVLRESEGW